jgi:hypothetical protein
MAQNQEEEIAYEAEYVHSNALRLLWIFDMCVIDYRLSPSHA